MGNIYGYIRVSSCGQNEARQEIAMAALAIPAGRLYIDKQSGKDFERPAYRALIQKLREGDVLYVKSIDRLGRNYEEIIEEWRRLTRERGADIVVLDMPLLDTRRGKDLLGTLIADLVLQVLSFAAENERLMIRERQREGIEAARAEGRNLGRHPAPLPENFPEIYRRWKAKEMTGRAAAEACGMALSTFRYRAEKYEKEGK